MRNKKLLGALLAVTTLATFGLAGCGDSGSNGSASKEDDKTITVAASPTPHAEILNKAVKPLVEKDGYKLEVKEFTDYVQPNTATEDGEVDANYTVEWVSPADSVEILQQCQNAYNEAYALTQG